MLKKKIEKAMNDQLSKEMFSSYLYLSMASWFEANGYDGMASWMKIQSQEEYEHAMKFYNYINERGGRVTLGAMEAPKSEWKSPIEIFEEAYKHECYITKEIHKLVDLVSADKDYPSISFLNWFVDEQVEEESAASKIIDDLKMVGDRGVSLYMLDKSLGKRGAEQ
jgi:ferritin